jgi:hypothetical protein
LALGTDLSGVFFVGDYRSAAYGNLGGFVAGLVDGCSHFAFASAVILCQAAYGNQAGRDNCK